MHALMITGQVIAALGLLNVWLLRANQSTPYRGGAAQNMREEFAAYGLPGWFLVVVGTLKVGAALALLAGIWYRGLVLPAALVVCFLMLGALSMHARVGDPLVKYMPAIGMLALSVFLVLGSVNGQR